MQEQEMNMRSPRSDASDGSAIDSHAFANSNSSSEAENDAALALNTPMSQNHTRQPAPGAHPYSDNDQHP